MPKAIITVQFNTTAPCECCSLLLMLMILLLLCERVVAVGPVDAGANTAASVDRANLAIQIDALGLMNVLLLLLLLSV